MNLENVWMFDGDAFYCPNQLLFLEPLQQYAGFNFEQFVSNMKQAAAAQPKPSIMKVVNGVAMVGINGALMPNKSLMMQALGGTSTSEVHASFQQIKRNPKIKGVFMQVNSPGGSAAGIDETAQAIHEVAQQIPVVAQVTGTAASAGYYLASQANKTFANSRTSMVGSVGTRLVLDDTSQAAAKQGVERVVIETGANKSIGIAGRKITSEQKAHLQVQVNQLQNFFEQSVKRGRPSVDVNSINDGSVWLADEAKRRGLIDGIQSGEQTMQVLGSLMRLRG
jgi:protease-4